MLRPTWPHAFPKTTGLVSLSPFLRNTCFRQEGGNHVYTENVQGLCQQKLTAPQQQSSPDPLPNTLFVFGLRQRQNILDLAGIAYFSLSLSLSMPSSACVRPNARERAESGTGRHPTNSAGLQLHCYLDLILTKPDTRHKWRSETAKDKRG